jgi:WD40 repeat protein
VWQARIANAERERAGEEKHKARESEANALRRAYNSDMSLAFRALEENLFGWVQESVRRHIPKPEAPDFRGWEWRYAWAQSQSDAVRAWDAIDDMDEVHAVQISPDQRYLVSSEFHYGPTSGIYFRRLWDFQTGEELKDVHLPGGSSRGFAFSNSGKYLALHHDTGNDKHEIQIYNTATWRSEVVITLDKWISRLSFSPDDKMLATVGGFEAVLWNWRQGLEQAKIYDWGIEYGRGEAYFDVAFFRKRPWLAIGGSKELKIVNTRTGRIEYRQTAPDRGITALAISPDDSSVAIGYGFEVSEIGLLDTASPDPSLWKREPNLVGHSRWVSSLTFSSKSGSLISSSADSTIRVWDMNSRDTTKVLRGHRSGVGSVSLTFDESGAVSAGTGQILEWDPNAPLSPFRERVLPEPAKQVVFAADSRTFYTVDGKGLISIWDLNTFAKQQSLSTELGERSSIVLSPDGKHLIAGTGSGDLWVLDAGNLQVVAEPEVESKLILPVGFSADGKSLVALESGNKISLWNVDTWELIDSVPIRPKVNYYYIGNYCAISPGSDMLLYPSGADLVCWDLKQLKKHTTVRVNPGRGGGIAFSPTEPLLASTAREGGGSIFLWNWQTRQRTGHPLRGTRALYSVAFSPDGRRLVTSSNGKGAVMLWDVSTGQEIARFGGSVARILNTVQFSPDGNTICAVDIEETAYFWRAPSWDEIDALEAERNRKEVAR